MGKYDAFMAATAPTPDTEGEAELRAAGVTVPKKYAAFMAATEAPETKPAEEPSLLDKYVVQPFKDIGNSVLRANDFAAGAITSPVETLGKDPGATLRETMRGVNSNIPFGRTIVEGLGGPAAESKEDAAAAPGAQDFGGVAGGFVAGKPVGGLVAKGIEVAAPVVGRALTRVGEAAKTRTLGELQRELTSTESGVVANAPRRLKVANDIEDIHAALQKPENAKIAAAINKPEKAVEEITKRQGELAKDARAPLYQELDDKVGGYNYHPLRTRLKGEIAALATDPGHGSERAALSAVLKDIDNTWGKQPGLVPTEKLRDFTTIAQGAADKALRGLDPAAASPIKRRVSAVIQDALKQHLEISEQLYPELKPVVAAISEYNTEASALANMKDAFANLAAKEKTGTVGIRKIIDNATGTAGHAVAATAALASGNPLPLLAPIGLKAGAAVAERTAMGANRALSHLAGPAAEAGTQAVARAAGVAPNAMGRLIELARSGLRGPELQAAAAQAGVPQDRVDEFAQLLAQHDARQVGR